MIKNIEEQKTTANRLAKETVKMSSELWLEHIFGGFSENEDLKDDEIFCDLFHWLSIEPEQLKAMTFKERIDFIICMRNQIDRISKLMGGE